MSDLISLTLAFISSGAVFALLGLALIQINKRLVKHFENDPARQYQRQLIMIAITLIGLVFAIVIIPINDTIRGQLLSLLGILVSATIALSSTTIVGNVVAGFMLKTLKNIRPGSYIHVAEHSGRVSEMDLIHTEIQTEDRDLTTLPNLFLATNPVTVLRSSGTILSVEVSLGYDVPRRKIEELLETAANKAGLKNPFVQIRELGDFSVLYRLGGLAEDVERVISTRRALRACVLDELHAGGVEIVSPTYMNTRAQQDGRRAIPPVDLRSVNEPEPEDGPSPEDLVFDKAQKAESVANLRKSRDELQQKIERCETVIKEMNPENTEELGAAQKERANLQTKLERLDRVIASAEAKMAQD